ncbi:MAG: hypothetical protein OXG69_06960, partial [bacterium]|nr:hypothetical protein [bacterium]
MGFLGGTYQGAAGVADVSCATEGADLSDPDANVVESGPKTFTVTASDAAGNTATRTVSIEIIEDTDSAGSWHKGDTLRPGHIYRHWPLFVEIPEGARISYGGSVSVTPEPGAPQDLPTQLQSFYAFSDPSRATILLIVSGTGEEASPPLGRRVCHANEGGGITSCDFRAPLTDVENEMWDRFLANIRTTPFPDGDPRNEPRPLYPLTPRGGQFSGSPPMCLSRGRVLMAIEPGRWLPYGDVPSNPLNLHAPNPLNLHGIPCDTPVGVHPSLLVGDAITVCVEGGAR